LRKFLDGTRTLRGAVSGAIAAAIWAFEQPLDKAVFGCQYDDVELLGKMVVRGDGWYPVGLAMHIGNGAVFGAIYANLAPLLPIAPPLRGPAVAVTEHFTFWPIGRLNDRFHPARDDLPVLTGNPRAFAQGLFRHLLFGLILGELERRVNGPSEPLPPGGAADFSSNGHGSLEHALSGEASG
jgi:hypothetical protein